MFPENEIKAEINLKKKNIEKIPTTVDFFVSLSFFCHLN